MIGAEHPLLKGQVLRRYSPADPLEQGMEEAGFFVYSNTRIFSRSLDLCKGSTTEVKILVSIPVGSERLTTDESKGCASVAAVRIICGPSGGGRQAGSGGRAAQGEAPLHDGISLLPGAT